MKHTPGPWKFDGACTIWAIKPKRPLYHLVDKVGDGKNSPSEEESRANGHLASAGPELLQIANHYLLVLIDRNAPGSRAMIKLIKNVINKAEGGY